MVYCKHILAKQIIAEPAPYKNTWIPKHKEGILKEQKQILEKKKKKIDLIIPLMLLFPLLI